MKIRIGPAGIGPVKEVEETFARYNKFGIKAAEIPFTYGVYIKKKEDAIRIGKEAKKQDIKLSIHAPYWINLNSREKKKIQESKERILKCCEIGNYLQAYRVIFHPGYYSGMDKEQTYQKIKKAILDIQKEIKKKRWEIKLAPETTGKKNVFGSVDEILRLVHETKCSFCLDFAHILAREKKVEYKEILGKFKKYKQLHVHFSGIVYGEKGEKHHVETKEKDIRELIENLKKHAKAEGVVIINEAPNPVKDAVKTLKFI